MRSLRSVSVVGLVLALSGCDEASSGSSVASGGKPDGGAASPTTPAVDPNIAAAVQEVARGSSPTDPASPGSGPAKAPPETGVFAPGVADAELARGAAPKLTVGTTGGSPKVSVHGLVLEPKRARELGLTVGVRTGPQAGLPRVDLLLKLEAAPVGAAEGADEAAAPVGLAVTGRLSSAKLSAEQPGRLPPDVEAAVKKLRGSRLAYRLLPDGSLTDVTVEPSPGVEDVLARVVEGVGELAASLHLPYPTEPVGPGAYWMVTSRERYVGLDVLAYRMLKVESVDGTRATISLATKRYVASGSVGFPGLPPHEVEEFRGEGRGELVVEAERGLVEGRVQDSLLANLAPEGQPQRRITVQLDVTSVLTVPGG